MPETLTPEIEQDLRNAMEWWITEAERLAVRETLQKLNPEELEKLDSTIKAGLQDIINDIQESRESIENVEYSMEGLGQLNNSEFFELFFEAEELKLSFPIWISDKLSELPHLQNSQSTIEITLWKHMVEKISIWWIAGTAGNAIWNMFTDKINGFQSAFSDKASENIEEKEEIGGFWQIAEIIGSIKEATDNNEEPSMNELGKLMEFIELLSNDYFDNLETVNALVDSSELSEVEKNNIINNPYIISELTKNWVYKKDGFNIDLKSWVLEISETQQDVESLQSEFIKEVANITNAKWDVIAWLKKKVNSIAVSLDKMDVSTNDLKSMIDWISKIPIFWTFLKWIADYFLWDGSIFNRLDELGEEKSIQESLENLSTFSKDQEDTDDLPWLVAEWKDGQVSSGNRKSTIRFLKKVGDIEKEQEIGVKDTIVDDATFWKEVFEKEDPENMSNTMQYIREATLTLRWNTKLSQEEFFETLSNTKIVIPKEGKSVSEAEWTEGDTWNEQTSDPVEAENQEPIDAASPASTGTQSGVDSIPPTAAAAWAWIIASTGNVDQNAATEIEETLPSLEEQIQNTESLPATLTFENRNEIMVDIWDDWKSIRLWDHIFNVEIIPWGIVWLPLERSVLKNIAFKNGELIITHLTGEKRIQATELVKTIRSLSHDGEIIENIYHTSGRKEWELQAVFRITLA